MPEARFIPPGAERDAVVSSMLKGVKHCAKHYAKHYAINLTPMTSLGIGVFKMIDWGSNEPKYCMIFSEMVDRFNHITNDVPNTWDAEVYVTITIGSTGEKFRVPHVWLLHKPIVPFEVPGTELSFYTEKYEVLYPRVLLPDKISAGDWIRNPFTGELVQVDTGNGVCIVNAEREGVYYTLTPNDLKFFGISSDQVTPFLVIEQF